MATPNFFSFSDSNNPYQDLLFPRSYKPRRNIPVLAATAVKKPNFLGPSRDAQNVCAVAKVGTILKCFLLLCLFAVIEVASGEYGDNVIPSLVKAWKAREESMTQEKSLTSSTSCSYDSRNMVVSMLPNCNVKTSTDSIIHAASQTTQVSECPSLHSWRYCPHAN